jgi:hypothetical protein
MTAIAIWCNNEIEENPSLWIVSDSRVSKGNSLLIEDAAKVFTLPIICKAPGSSGFFTDIYYQHSFGFCFAGSTLMGQNSFLALQPLLGNLSSVENYIPSIEDVGNYILNYLKKTFDDYKISGGASAVFEAAIFGYCHVAKKLQIIHISPVFEPSGCFLTMTTKSCTKRSDFIYLGDNKTEMKKKISNALNSETVPGRPVTRAPRYVIDDAIEDEQMSSIGGDIQLGIADTHGFMTYKICKPYKKGEPASYFSYLGRELTDDLAYIGKAMVVGNAMV